MKLKIIIVVVLTIATTLSANSGNLKGFNSDIIDTSINPGDDFYTYASGLWLKNETCPEGVGRFGYYNLADKIIEDNIFNLMNGTIQFDSTDHLASLVTNLYQSAMDTVAINNIGITAISDELEQIEEIKTLADLQRVITRLILIGFDPFFELYRPKPWQIIDTNYACFSQTRLGLSNNPDYSGNVNDPDSKIGQYRSFVNNLLGTVTKNKEELEFCTKNVILIETELASKMMSYENLKDFDKTYNLYEIKKLKSLIPQFDWEVFLGDLGMTGTNKVIIGQPKYFKKVGNVLKIFDIESLKSYLKFVLIYRASPYLHSEIANIFWRFKIDFCGWQEISREIFVYDIINRDMPDAVGALFIEEYFSPTKKNGVLSMIGNLKTAFRNRVKNNEWISESSQNDVLIKLKKMKFLIGGPDKYVDYDNLNFDNNNFVRNLLLLREFSNRRYLSKMGTVKNNYAWSVNPHSTNAWYSPNRNLITLPAGNICEFWSSDDNAWNYSTLGTTIAHEITHGFDATGRKFDENGNSIGFWKNVTAWFGSDNDHFEDCASLLEKKYNKFVVLDSFYVNGENTLNENLADLGGLNIAYDAYILLLNGQEPDTVNGYNGYQRFFLSYAQKWRELFEEKTLIRSLSGYHAPPQYRTNGVVYNLSGFYEAFNINKSDKMYLPPEDRIIVW